MDLRPIQIESWPKLAWVARLPLCAKRVDVFHGPMVEVGSDWCVEAVWAGEFEDGDFDRTDLVFGSGVRRRPPALGWVGLKWLNVYTRRTIYVRGMKGNCCYVSEAVLKLVGPVLGSVGDLCRATL